jgi:hypothetical protein
MNKQGKITPSGFADMMTRGRGVNDEFGETAKKYAMRIALERLGVEIPEVEAWAMQHGNAMEPYAIQAYKMHTGFEVIDNLQPIQHPSILYIAGTPDGLVGDDGILEVKCPYNPVNHLMNLKSGEQIAQYKWQIQGYLWITNRQWCDFVSYDDRFPDELQLYIQRIERAQIMIDELHERAAKFEILINSILEGIVK